MSVRTILALAVLSIIVLMPFTVYGSNIGTLTSISTVSTASDRESGPVTITFFDFEKGVRNTDFNVTFQLYFLVNSSEPLDHTPLNLTVFGNFFGGIGGDLMCKTCFLGMYMQINNVEYTEYGKTSPVGGFNLGYTNSTEFLRFGTTRLEGNSDVTFQTPGLVSGSIEFTFNFQNPVNGSLVLTPTEYFTTGLQIDSQGQYEQGQSAISIAESGNNNSATGDNLSWAILISTVAFGFAGLTTTIFLATRRRDENERVIVPVAIPPHPDGCDCQECEEKKRWIAKHKEIEKKKPPYFG